MNENCVLKNMALTDLLTWLILTEKIKNLKQQQKWTGDSITSLQRCQDDFDNINVMKLAHARERAEGDIADMAHEINQLQKHLESIEKRAMQELGLR